METQLNFVRTCPGQTKDNIRLLIKSWKEGLCVRQVTPMRGVDESILTKLLQKPKAVIKIFCAKILEPRRVYLTKLIKLAPRFSEMIFR